MNLIGINLEDKYMAKYKHVDYEQGLMLPIDFTKQIIPGTFEFTLNYLIDNHVNTSIFDNKYNNDETGAPAYDPGIMLKIILFAYSRGITSSRAIALACRENITFKALSANSEPDFTTIAAFVSCMPAEAIKIFRDVLLVCSELDLIGGEMFALDGCKITSNASKEWSGTFKDLEKRKEKFEKTIKLLAGMHKKSDQKEGRSSKNKNEGKERIAKIRKKVEKIKTFLEENEPKERSRIGEKQSNITDNESAKMHGSHGIIQGYNGLALTDSRNQVIFYPEAFGSGPEAELLKTMIEGAKDTAVSIELGKDFFKDKIFIADTGSFSEDNLKFLSKEKIDAYIPDQQFRKRDPRFDNAKRYKDVHKKIKRFEREDFVYNENEDMFICPGNKKLSFERIQIWNKTEGRMYRSSSKDCRTCKFRKRCLKSENSRHRSLYVIDTFFDRNHSKEMINKIDTTEGRDIYSKRMGIVEPVFGNITYAKGLNRFTLRGKKKVNIQWTLYCLVHNIEKICNFGDMDKFMASG